MGAEGKSIQRYKVKKTDNSGVTLRPSTHSTPPEYSTITSSAANGAKFKDDAGIVINKDKSGISRTFVKENVSNTIKDTIINPSKSQAYADKVWSREQAVKKTGLVKTAGKMIISEAEAKTSGERDLADRTRVVAARYAFRGSRYAASGAVSVISGSVRYGRFAAKLAEDAKEKALEGNEASTVFLKTVRGSLADSGVSIGKIIKKEAIKDIVDMKGSDDLGMQAIVKPKDAIVRASRTLRLFNTTGRAVRTGVHGTANVAKKAAHTTAEMVRYVTGAVKNLFANPIFVKGAIFAGLVMGAIALVLAVVTAITAIVPSVSLKSDSKELTRTFEYITKLDAELTDEIRSIPEKYNDAGLVRFYLNGAETSAENILIYTNADLVLLYLDTKYGAYAFDKLLYGIFGGTNVKDEVTAIHNTLYSYSIDKREESIEYTSSVTDPETGEINTTVVTEIISRVDVNVTTKSFEQYLFENKEDLLTKTQIEQMEILENIGMYTARVELGSPFKDDAYYITSRWGWRIHPISGEVAMHNGVDIPKAEGTPINNVLRGKVTTVGYDADGYGNYIIVSSSKKEVLYAHMSSVTVSQGQDIEKGEIIGYVGNTGASTGAHLHLEYSIENGFKTNPAFFLEGVSLSGMNTTGFGSNDIVMVAISQIGNVGGQPYWSWYGFNARVAWCACFVSWCAEQCGYIQAGIIPKFAYCPTGEAWFKSNGIWQQRGYNPQPGDIIFFDWEGDGVSDHVGIVEYCDGATVYTVEGNTSNSVRRRSYAINSSSIKGYGTPAYPKPTSGNISGNTNAEIAWNFFKSKGFNDYGTAGILGNFQTESPGINPAGHQWGGGPGRGIAQWEVGGRHDNLVRFAAQRGTEWTDLVTQLEFTWHELNGGDSMTVSILNRRYGGLNGLMNAGSIEFATEAFLRAFERASIEDLPGRIRNGYNFYNLYSK